MLDQNAEKRKERFNELTGEKISEEPANKPNEEPKEPNSRIYTTVTESADSVNHPAHYKHGDIATLDIIRMSLTAEEFQGFLKGNVLKYQIRAPFKHETPDEDYAKAKYYYDEYREVTE